MLAKFFAQFVPHLTKAQLAAKQARENCGRPGRRKDALDLDAAHSPEPGEA